MGETTNRKMGDELVNIGINHPAYKVGKREILEWANDVLDSNLQDVASNIGDGAAYCQLLHSVNRKCVNMKNVKFDAKDDYSYNINYNTMQKAFKILNIDKIIRPDALMRGKPLDNLEFIQWLKHYCTHVGGEENYSGMAERHKHFPGLAKKNKRWAGCGKSSTSGGALKESASNNKPAGSKPVAAKKPAARRVAARAPAKDSGVSEEEVKALKISLADKEEEGKELQSNLEAIEKERDFYFGKLRDIEVLCQEREGDDMPEELSKLVGSIKEIMYATDDADAVEVDEDEDL